jgi:two-component system LytT family response regulator
MKGVSDRPSRFRVLIADDEPPARRRVRTFLEQEHDIDIVAEAGDADDAIALIESARPDIVFLDIQMPGATGFDIVEAIGSERMPAVVFVTAHDEFALRAFEAHALDYVLKPFDGERLRAALHRARTHARQRSSASVDGDQRLLALLAELRRLAPAPAYLERVVVKHDGRIRFVPVSDIDYLEAESNYVRIHARGASHLVRETLSSMETRLDPRLFLRVHRSLIVNLGRIVELEPLFQGEYVLRLRDGTKLTSGRTYRTKIQQALGLAG